MKGKMNKKSNKLIVGVTRDFISPEGDIDFVRESWDALLDHPGIELKIMDEPAQTEITVNHTRRFDAIIMKRSPLRAGALAHDQCRLKLVARDGVGYDHLDVDACTKSGVMIAITPEAVCRPVASTNVVLMLAFAHRLFERDQRTREGAWDKRSKNRGIGLQGRALGVIGLGNIGQEIFRLMKPWGMIHLGVAPNHTEEEFSDLGVRLVDLDTILAEADFLCLCCPLSEETHHMIGERELRLMKPEAYLINTARGEVINEPQLTRALREGWIAGAGLDVFEQEPPSTNNPLLSLANVILGSHNLAICEEMNELANRGVAEAVLALADGTVPKDLVNPEIVEHPNLKKFFELPN
jgi:D-3-phosphoglycerate dehydrogenase